MKRGSRLTLMLALCISMVSIVSVKGAASTANVAITPSTLQLPASQIGQSFSVNITVEGVANLTDWETQILFNPSVLRVTNVEEGPFLKSGGSQTEFLWSGSGSADLQNGKIDEIGDVSLSNVTVDGTGTLAILNFTVLSSGESSISLNGTRLLSPGIPRGSIDCTLTSANVTVLGASSYRIPSEMYFVISAGALFAVLMVSAVVLQGKKGRKSKHARITRS